jgi:hypothetical protein
VWIQFVLWCSNTDNALKQKIFCLSVGYCVHVLVQLSRVILVAKRGANGVKGLTTEGRAGRSVGPEGGFVTSLVGNICPVPIVRSLAHSTAYGDTCQQWLTPAQAGLTKKFKARRGRLSGL